MPEQCHDIQKDLTEKVMPEVKKTMSQVCEVLDKVNTLLDMGIFTAKVLAMLFVLCSANNVIKLIAEIQPTTIMIENLVLQLIYYLCLVIALVLVLATPCD